MGGPGNFDAINKASHAAYLQLADRYFESDMLVEAQRCYQMARIQQPTESEPFVGLGSVAMQQGEFEEAQAAFYEALRMDPNCAPACMGIALIDQARGNYDGAFTWYARCLRIEPDDVVSLLGLFRLSCETHSYEAAIAHLASYYHRHKEDVSVAYALAALYVNIERCDDARLVLENILKIDPGHEKAAALLEETERLPSEPACE